jgi:hypothetical protein
LWLSRTAAKAIGVSLRVPGGLVEMEEKRGRSDFGLFFFLSPEIPFEERNP